MAAVGLALPALGTAMATDFKGMTTRHVKTTDNVMRFIFQLQAKPKVIRRQVILERIGRIWFAVVA